MEELKNMSEEITEEIKEVEQEHKEHADDTLDISFAELNLDETVLEAVEKLGFEHPTKVQAQVIPRILDNEDVFVMSETGSGKTAAFALPVIQKLIGSSKLRALILTPTRELAVQVDKDIKTYSTGTGVKSTAVYGQHNMNVELEELASGVNIVVGTPGRVFDHIDNKGFSTKDINFLVLDEADRMLDMGFYDQVVKIIKRLPRDRVTMCFSATLPYEIKNISMQYMNSPVNIDLGTDVKTVDSIEQCYYKVDRHEKRKSLKKLIDYYQPASCMVFCNTRDEVDRVTDVLRKGGIYCDNLHGANSQFSRTKTIDKFKDKKVQVVVATDVAARGIHIEDLEMVINYDVPDNKDNYVHRVGRTGRAGKKGLAVNLVSSESIITLYEIEEHVGALIEEKDMPTDAEIKERVEQSTTVWSDMEPAVYKKEDRRYKKDDKKIRGKFDKSYGKNNKKKHKNTDKSDKKKHEKIDNKTAKVEFKADFKENKKNASKPKRKTEIRNVAGLGNVEFIVKEKKKKGFFARLFGL